MAYINSTHIQPNKKCKVQEKSVKVIQDDIIESLPYKNGADSCCRFKFARTFELTAVKGSTVKYKVLIAGATTNPGLLFDCTGLYYCDPIHGIYEWTKMAETHELGVKSINCTVSTENDFISLSAEYIRCAYDYLLMLVS